VMVGNFMEEGTHSYVAAIQHAGLSSQSVHPLQLCASIMLTLNVPAAIHGTARRELNVVPTCPGPSITTSFSFHLTGIGSAYHTGGT